MFKKFKLFTLCSILMTSSLAHPLTKTELFTRSAYLGLTAAFYKKVYQHDIGLELTCLGSYALMIVIYCAEETLKDIKTSARQNAVNYCCDISQKYEKLLELYTQLENSYTQKDFVSDRSALLIATCQEINKNDDAEVLQIRTTLNKAIQTLAVHGYTDTWYFIKAVRIFFALDGSVDSVINGHYCSEHIKKCRDLLTIKQRCTPELINPLDSSMVINALLAKKQASHSQQVAFDNYLQQLAQDCKTVESIQIELAKTTNHDLQIKAGELLANLRTLECTINKNITL